MTPSVKTQTITQQKKRTTSNNIVGRHPKSFANVIERHKKKSPKTVSEMDESGKEAIDFSTKNVAIKDNVMASKQVIKEHDDLLQKRILLHLLQSDRAGFMLNDGYFKDTQFQVERYRHYVKLISKTPHENASRLLRCHKSELKDQLKSKGMDLLSFEII